MQSLADEILQQLPLADKGAVWGTLGTIRPHLNFEVDSDIQTLLGAVSGKGVEYGIIIDLLTSRSADQRQHISEEFLDFTKQDLLKTVKAAVSGNVENIIVGLLMPAAQYDAHEIHASLKGSEGEVLTEILSTRTNQKLREILDYYQRDFNSDLEKDIISGTSGFLKDLLLALMKGDRERYAGIIDYVLIKQDTEALMDAGVMDTGDRREWIRILTQRCPEHLARVFSCYASKTGLQVEEALKKHFDEEEEAQETALILVSVLRNTPRFFATKLYQAIKGPKTCPRTVARIMISRSEIDLLSIRAEFRKRYGISLYSFIQAETDNDDQTALLGLCRAEDL